MNEVSELTVQYVNPPKEGKKWGSIKSSEGESFFGPPSILKDFSVGEVAKVEWQPFGEGGKSKALVKKIWNGQPNPPKQFTRPSTSKSDSEQIFTVALLKEYIGAGMVALDTSALTAAINKIRSSWNQTFGGSIAQRRDDLDDEIPI